MRFRHLTMTIAAGALAFGSVAAAERAEEPADHLVDIAGDANFLNGQGFQPGTQQSTAPLSMPGADLQGIRFETVRNGGIVDGLRAHVRMDQPADAGGPELVVRVVANINGCPTMLATEKGPITGVSGYLRLTDAGACGNPEEDYDPALGTANYTDGVTVESTDTGYTFTMTFTDGLPDWARGFLKDGATIAEVDAHVRTFIGVPGVRGVTAPVVDELLDPEFTSWKIGSDA